MNICVCVREIMCERETSEREKVLERESVCARDTTERLCVCVRDYVCFSLSHIIYYCHIMSQREIM